MNRLSLTIGLTIICCVISSSCRQGSNTNTVPIVEFRHPIVTATGNVCPFFEDEIFTINGKAIFNDCDLRVDSRLLDGKLLRVKSKYWMTRPHGSTLTSGPCNQTTSTVEPVSVAFEYPTDQDYILGALEANPADIQAIGRFHIVEPSKKSDSISDNARFHFDLICLEKAAASK